MSARNTIRATTVAALATAAVAIAGCGSTATKTVTEPTTPNHTTQSTSSTRITAQQLVDTLNESGKYSDSTIATVCDDVQQYPELAESSFIKGYEKTSGDSPDMPSAEAVYRAFVATDC